MNRNLQIKLVIIAALVLWSLWALLPTLQLARGTEGMDAEKVASLEDRSIRRGLDLAGGMYLILEVDKQQLADSEMDLSESEALDRVITVMRNRIDEFGVSEPDIRKEGNSRVVVQLPGLQDPERAKALIGRTARLTFRLTREAQDFNAAIERVDRVVAGLSPVGPPPTRSARRRSTSRRCPKACIPSDRSARSSVRFSRTTAVPPSRSRSGASSRRCSSAPRCSACCRATRSS